MNKKLLLFFSLFLIVALFLAGCKNSAEINIAEKKDCFKKCMLVEEDKAYCLDDCDLEEKDVEEKPKDVCGDSVCQPAEKENNLCPQDCSICSTDADCGEKKICKDNQCTAVECTEDSHCDDGYACESNICTEEEEDLDTAAAEKIQDIIDDVQSQIETFLDQIDAVQTSLDSTDASDEDIAAIQEDIDALDEVITQLETYKDTLASYEEDLDAAETNAAVVNIGTTVDAAKEEIEAYIEEQQKVVNGIEEAIADLEPAVKPDLVVEDLDLESVDGNDGTFTITFANDDEGNITANDSFRVKLTNYEEDNSTEVDDVKATFSDGLEPDEEEEVEVELEIEYSPEDYFRSNTAAQKYIVLFLVEVDVDDTINESNEDNNDEYFSITFDREDYISNLNPTAVIAANATSVLVDEVITFLGTASSDSDGSIVSYNWTFGETSVVETGAMQTHSYDFAGTYTVTLVVTDNEGATGTDTETITVT